LKGFLGNIPVMIAIRITFAKRGTRLPEITCLQQLTGGHIMWEGGAAAEKLASGITLAERGTWLPGKVLKTRIKVSIW
jgi:hypothetical protein